ncbi:hypothetical protein [Zavarzinella formosa]|uniref:hypothetical protein n=1 Tax=Zavarzinella formosa TaxID=360055 RepID=UPI00036728F8|nr:hypothetical protein [Zavarzinella formosa]
MSNRLVSLFSSKNRPARRPAATQARLNVEGLDERSLLSVSSAVVTNGVLTIACDNYATTATVANKGNDVVVTDTFTGGRTILDVPASQVNKIVYTGGTNPDRWYYFTNSTNIATDYKLQNAKGFDVVNGGSGASNFYAGPQSSFFYGGNGVNNFYDNTATECQYYAGNVGSVNVLHRAGARTTNLPVSMFDPLSGTSGQKLTIGLDPNAYKYDLNQGGDMTASLENKTDLTLTGPTGAGFKLRGNWTDTLSNLGNGQYSHTFKSSGAVTLVTGSVLSNFQINPGSNSITITTKAGRQADSFGVFDKFSMNVGSFNLPTSTLTDKLNDLGISANLPQASWGIALGEDITGNGQALAGAPLNDGVPYLYASLGSTDGSAASISFGNTSASVGKLGGAQVAFDPADPFLYARVATGSSAGTWAAGYSVHGDIPFTPEKWPDALEDRNTIRGNVYLSGRDISLGSLPASVSGEMVIDLDANDDGTMAGGKLKDMLSTPMSSTAAALKDMAVGVNGEISLGYNLGGVNLSVKAGSGTLMYQPGMLAVAAGSDNPFAGTPLEKFAPKTGEIEIDGLITWGKYGTPHWNLTGTMTNRATGGFFGSQMVYSINDYTISAHSSYYADLYVASANMTTDLSLGYDASTHGFFVNASMHGYVQFGTSGYNLYGDVDASFKMSYASGNLTFDGSASISGGATFAGSKVFSIGVSARVNNSGFSLSLPFDKELKLSW